MAATISEKSRHLIQIILTDEKVAEKLLENREDFDKYKVCTVNNNGSVVLGKTKVLWWNKLLNCQTIIPFESFALKVWDALVDLSTGINNEAIMNGLSHEIVVNSMRDRNYDWVIERLYDCWSHVAQLSKGYINGIEALTAGSCPDDAQRVGRQSEYATLPSSQPSNLVINIEGTKRIIPIIDSVGDPLNIGLEIGITGVRRIR